MNKSARLVKWVVSLPPTLFLILFFVLPSILLVAASFRLPGEHGGLAPIVTRDAQGWRWGLTAETYRFFFSDFIYTEIFIKSFAIALLTTLICIGMGYPLAWLIARSPKRYRDRLVLLVVLPFASNFLIRVYAWMIILGPQAIPTRIVNGLLGIFGWRPVTLLFSTFAVVIGLVYVHLPFMILPLYANLEKHDPDLLDAAQDLGANAWQRFWRVTWPLSMPGIYAGSALVFISVLGMFALPELLGGTGDILIGNLIKEQFLGTRDWPFGATLAIMLTLLVLGLAGLAAWFSRRGVRHA